MKPTTSLLCLSLASLLTLSAGAQDLSGIATSAVDAQKVFNDPEWQKGFLGSYQVLQEVEPKINPEEVELLQNVLGHMENSDLDLAVRQLREGMSENSSAALNFILANLLFQSGDIAGARGEYKSAIEKESAFRRAYKNLGMLSIQEGNYGEGIANLSKAVELGEREARTYGLLGYCFLQQNRALAAQEAYRDAIVLDPENQQWKLGLVQTLMDTEKYGEGIALVKELLNADPVNLTYWKLLANAYIGLDRPLKAATALEMARTLGDSSTSTLSLLGDIYMNEKMYGLARDVYIAALEKESDRPEVSVGLRAAELLFKTRQNEKARELAAAIDQNYPEISGEQRLDLLTLTARIERRLGNEEEAAETLEQIVSEDGTQGDALLELADYYWQNDEEGLAMEKLSQALELNSFRYDALIKKAQLLVSRRDYSQAAELLQEALSLRDEPRIRRYYNRVLEASEAS